MYMITYNVPESREAIKDYQGCVKKAQRLTSRGYGISKTENSETREFHRQTGNKDQGRMGDNNKIRGMK